MWLSMSLVAATASSWDKPLRQLQNPPPGQSFCIKAPCQETAVRVKALSWDINKVRKFHKCIHQLSLTLF